LRPPSAYPAWEERSWKRELKPDRLINHMSELPAAVESLMDHRKLSI